VSPHWLRHAHGSHAIERGASLPEVQATLGHGNIATTSGYLHARPDSSSGSASTRECFFDEDESD
jgi:integrase/recombinase XerD